jgi:hypothetical protein
MYIEFQQIIFLLSQIAYVFQQKSLFQITLHVFQLTKLRGLFFEI